MRVAQPETSGGDSGPGMEQCEQKLGFGVPPSQASRALPRSTGFGKGSDRAPTLPVWHAVDIFSLSCLGLTLVVLEEVVPYSIACGAIDGIIH